MTYPSTVQVGMRPCYPYTKDKDGHPIEITYRAQWGDGTPDTVNGLAGNAEAYPGSFSYQAEYYCPTPGTETLTMSTTPPANYVLIVTAPNGVSELRTDNNSAQIYIRPDAKISP